MFDPDIKSALCDCCDYTPTDLKRYSGLLLCEICYSTYLSEAAIAPSQCPDVQLYKSIAWIANRLLAEIKERQEQ